MEQSDFIQYVSEAILRRKTEVGNSHYGLEAKYSQFMSQHKNIPYFSRQVYTQIIVTS
jgi:NADH:ubiquinone oxidoreductase subunit D